MPAESAARSNAVSVRLAQTRQREGEPRLRESAGGASSGMRPDRRSWSGARPSADSASAAVEAAAQLIAEEAVGWSGRRGCPKRGKRLLRNASSETSRKRSPVLNDSVDTRIGLAGLLLGACLVTGCVAPAALPKDAEAVRPTSVPFHPQDQWQCGPAALATILGASGIEIAPGALVPEVWIPDRRGTLAPELAAATRRHGRIAWQITPSLEGLIAELAAGADRRTGENRTGPLAAAPSHSLPCALRAKRPTKLIFDAGVFPPEPTSGCALAHEPLGG